jgi:hypothetical protein
MVMNELYCKLKTLRQRTQHPHQWNWRRSAAVAGQNGERASCGGQGRRQAVSQGGGRRWYMRKRPCAGVSGRRRWPVCCGCRHGAVVVSRLCGAVGEAPGCRGAGGVEEAAALGCRRTGGVGLIGAEEDQRAGHRRASGRVGWGGKSGWALCGRWSVWVQGWGAVACGG